MTLAIASLTHNPISATAFSSKPRSVAKASIALRTPARLAGSLCTFNSMRRGEREEPAEREVVIGRSVTARAVRRVRKFDLVDWATVGSIIQFFCSLSQFFHLS